MHLKIGILGEQDGWKLLLQQIGIPHVVVTNTLLPDEFSAAVVSDDINDRESEMLRQYLTELLLPSYSLFIKNTTSFFIQRPHESHSHYNCQYFSKNPGDIS